MERSEPALVPQWLKSNGSIGGGGNRINHTSSSTLQPDHHVAALPTRSRLSPKVGDNDSSRSSPFSERTSSYRRNSNSNGSLIHEKDSSAHLRPYSSFSRSNRDRDREKNLRDFREKSIGNHRDHDYHDPLGTSSDFLMNRFEKDTLRRSKSMISGKRGEVGPKRVAADLSNNNNNSHQNFLGVGGSIVGSIHKVAFERDFPSLGTEEKQGAPDTERVSPGLSTAVQILPISTSAVIGGNGWTSALAEVPALNGNSKMGLSSVQQTVPASSANVAPSMASGLNMAETLAQAPSRTRTTPQVSVETQRLEELAIKQSRQLIPMTPSMPKTSVLNAEKSKPKAANRSEMSVATKISHQQLTSSNLVNHSPRGGPAKSDVAKTNHVGKLLVLKAVREKNGISSAANENLIPTNSSRPVNNPPSLAIPATSATLGSPNNRKVAPAERKASLPLTHSSSMEKRPATSQAQSRNDFFDLMRKKTSTNPSAGADPIPIASESSGELIAVEVVTATVRPQGRDSPSSDPSFLVCSTENGVKAASDGDDSGDSQRFPDNEDYSTPIDEEEVAFLRSLGWEENAGEEVAITEEEIDAFNKRYMEFRPSLKLRRGMQHQKLGMLFKSRVDIADDAFSILSSSGSESEK
ncbi:hypothetical protein BVC80_1519g40 [Macleaya cordata]|uniref:Uncharacterized protein n=1 Tax=Macleaya cordata TaxID=56857 RepID=A0A200PTL1_MACCD|nr:hypothetical protein BVC80_1519g40 [Macleaya cordata]